MIRFAALFLFLVLFLSKVNAQDRVSIKVIADNGFDASIFDAYKNDLSGILGSRYIVDFNRDDIYFHDLSRQDILSTYDSFESDPEVDFILIYGTYAATQINLMERFKKPTFVVGLVSNVLQGFQITEDQTTGVDNLTLVVSEETGGDLEAFNEIYPFENIAIITDWRVAEMIRGTVYFKEEFDSTEISYSLIGAYDDAEKVVEVLPEETDAIAFGPLLGMSRENRIRLIDALNLAQYPTLSFGIGYIADHSLVNKSIYGNSDQIMRRLALNTEAVLGGMNAGDLKVFIKMDRPMVINMEIAKLIGFSPEFTVLQKYPSINEDKISSEKLMGIEEVLYNVVTGSLGLRSAELDFEQFSKEVGISRSQILPYLVANLDGAIKDPNQSSQSLGLDPQYQVTGSMNFSQLVYSELAFSQVRIQKTLRAAAELGFQEQTLDFLLEGMIQYLDILRSKADLQIQISNKEITSTNLKIAEQRLEVGQSGRSEVFRWESNLANANQAVVEARNRLDQQKIQLNASLNFPLDHEFDVTDLSLEVYPFIRYRTEGYYPYITNQAGLDKGIEFMLAQAIENLPAYAQVEENVRAIEQRLNMYKRDRFIPDVSVNANVTGRFYRGGEGWEPNNPNFLTPSKYFWSVGAKATIPLFQGNLTNTYVQQSRIALDLQENELARFEQDLEESIRQQILQVVTAKTNIDFTEDASVAANKALDLTQDSYSEGTVSIVELIDAQNNALTSELAFINSEYNFLIEILRLERLMGSFLLLRTPEENQEIVNEFLQFQPEAAPNE